MKSGVRTAVISTIAFAVAPVLRGKSNLADRRIHPTCCVNPGIERQSSGVSGFGVA
jgi:hypothetical protein